MAQIVKNLAASAEDQGSVPGSGRSPGEGHGKPLQYSCLENPHGQRSLGGYSPRGCKESDTTEPLTHRHAHVIDSCLWKITSSVFENENYEVILLWTFHYWLYFLEWILTRAKT